MDGYHEPPEELSQEARNRHRILRTIIEEFEAVDWYDQRADVCSDEEVAGIMTHNRNEELEHAAMALEWLRRNDPVADEYLREFLFTEGSLLEAEAEAHGAGAGELAASGRGLMN